jgi:hypothetical protein
MRLRASSSTIDPPGAVPGDAFARDSRVVTALILALATF